MLVPLQFADKVVLITGASGGIGAATVACFAGRGARLALLDKNAEALAALATEIGGCWHMACDVADETSMAGAIRAAAAAHGGRIDVGVLNAAISGRRTPLQDTGVEQFDAIMGVNARGVFLGLKHLFPVMRAQGGGAVVLTASTESLRGNTGLSPYVASKHAVLGLCRTAALEWAPHNIRVNCVNPGPVDTSLIREIERLQIAAGDSQVRERNTARIPLKRYAKPEEVAAFIAFLASDEAGFSTGGTYLLDGGILAGKTED